MPADFGRFQMILHDLAPSVMATAAAPAVDGWVSLSLHAGASIPELRAAGADPERLLLVEVSPNFPRTMRTLRLCEADVAVNATLPVQ